jgi:hypothetical protein
VSTQPPLPAIGQDPWGDDLNAYLSALDSRLTKLESPLPYWDVVNQGPVTLPATAAWTTVPTTGVQAITFPNDTVCQMVISCNLDSAVNNNQVQLALDLSGATVVPAGSRPEQVLWAGGKQAVQSTLECTSVQTFLAGTTNLAVMYTAQQANAIVSAMALIITIVSA